MKNIEDLKLEDVLNKLKLIKKDTFIQEKSPFGQIFGSYL